MPHTLAAAAHSELTIKKSRFIGCVQPVADRATAQKVVAGLWAEHPTATHVCWALMAGGHSAAVDDGEPSGTAGRPMLDVLRHHDLEGVLATVVRYYGGVNLGAGGLVRAYTDAVAQALLKADKVLAKQHEKQAKKDAKDAKDKQPEAAPATPEPVKTEQVLTETWSYQLPADE